MYIEGENTASKHPLEVRRKKYVELNKKDVKNPFNKIKEAFTRIRSLVKKPEEIEERKSATGYELYHKDFSSAMQHAYDFAKSKGHIVDPKEIDDKVATGPKKPSSGKVNRYSLKAGRKRVEI